MTVSSRKKRLWPRYMGFIVPYFYDANWHHWPFRVLMPNVIIGVLFVLSSY